jgi:acylglycerol lipase
MKPHLDEKTWSSYDGKVMPWKQGHDVVGEKPRAIVITIHGLSGAASDFWMLEQDWPALGIAVYGLELRGQGNDPNKFRQGDISKAGVWQRDLLTFQALIRHRHHKTPIFWYAESLGTLIAMHTVTDEMDTRREWPAGIIMASPAAGLKLRPTGMKSVLLNTAITVLPAKRVSLEELAGVDDKDIRITHDTTFGAQMSVTSHFVKTFTLRLLGEVDKMMRTAPASAARLQVPVLMLASPKDVIASEAQIQSLFDQLKSKDKTLHWYRKSQHLLLHDLERDQVMKDATNWIEKRISQR